MAWYNGMTEDNRKRFAVSTFRCPTRHGSKAISSGYARSGPLADYAVPVCRPTGTRDWWHHFCIYSTNFKESDMKGPFVRPALSFISPAPTTSYDITGITSDLRSISNWTLQADMSRWADGTSNQFAIVEKHVPRWAIGGDTSDPASHWDGSWFFTYTNANAYISNRVVCWTGHASCYENLARNMNYPITVDESPESQEGAFKLGSGHPGILNVLLGDGSVRAVAVTTPPQIAWQLTCVDDGTPVSLP